MDYKDTQWYAAHSADILKDHFVSNEVYIWPNYEVKNSIQDVIEGNDRVLEFALNLVGQKKQ